MSDILEKSLNFFEKFLNEPCGISLSVGLLNRIWFRLFLCHDCPSHAICRISSCGQAIGPTLCNQLKVYTVPLSVCKAKFT